MLFGIDHEKAIWADVLLKWLRLHAMSRTALTSVLILYETIVKLRNLF